MVYHGLNLEERHCEAGTENSGVDASRIQRRSPILLDFRCLEGASVVSAGTSGDGVMMMLVLGVLETGTK